MSGRCVRLHIAGVYAAAPVPLAKYSNVRASSCPVLARLVRVFQLPVFPPICDHALGLHPQLADSFFFLSCAALSPAPPLSPPFPHRIPRIISHTAAADVGAGHTPPSHEPSVPSPSSPPST